LCEVVPNIVSFSEVVDFMINTWAPIVDSLHCRNHGVLIDFVQSVYEAVKDLPTNEVIQMVLSKSQIKSDKEFVISLYMPMLTGYLPAEVQQIIDDVKRAVVESGGKKMPHTDF
jgi:hypothetical protein